MSMSASQITQKRQMVDVHCHSMTCKGAFVIGAREGSEVLCGRCGKWHKVTTAEAQTLKEQMAGKRQEKKRKGR